MLLLLLQFTDDTNILKKATSALLTAITEVLYIVENNLGLKVNYDKTLIVRIGSMAKTNATLYTQKQYTWTNLPIYMLGIWVTDEVPQMNDLNLRPLLSKTKDVLGAWQNRTLTLMGRVLIVNTLVESLMVYRFSILSNIDEKILEELKTMVIHFIWQGK